MFKLFALYLNDDEISLKRDKVFWEWRKLHNEELCDLYSLPKIIRVIKSRRMRLAGHIARARRGVHRVLVGKREGKRPLGGPGVDGRMILRWNWEGEMDCIAVAQDRDRWRTFVDAVMYLVVP